MVKGHVWVATDTQSGAAHRLEALALLCYELSEGTLQSMATYVYETIPSKKGEKPKRFEIQQKMSEPALTTHPETGVAVRRVIIGGSGWVTHGASIMSMKVPRSKR